MEEQQCLYDLLDRLGMRDKLARETIALLLEIDPELERPIDHNYQLVGERIGRCYTTVSHRVRAGIKRAWDAPTAELERVFNVSICPQPVKPRHFLRIIKEISEKERRTTMIEVYKDWVIAIDSRQYITGKRYRDKKGNVSMTNQRYFRTLSQAIADIAERVSKERLQDKDMSLEEAVEVLRITYKEFGAKVDELNMLLKEQDSYQAKGAE